MDEQRLAELEQQVQFEKTNSLISDGYPDDILDLISEINRLQSELANAKTHAEVQILQAKEAAYNDVIEYLYAWYNTLTIVGVIEAVKGLRDKVQRQQAGKE